jgi:hypothetical protein
LKLAMAISPTKTPERPDHTRDPTGGYRDGR